MAHVLEERAPRRSIRFRLRAEGDELRPLLATRAGRVLVGAVVAIAALTVIGLLALWPYGWKSDASPVSLTVPAKVKKVIDAPCGGEGSDMCRSIVATVEGRDVSIGIGPLRNAPAISAGDSARLMPLDGEGAKPGAGVSSHYHFAEVDRRQSMLWLAVLLAVVAAALLRWRGVLAVVGVVASLAVLLGFMVPAILAGRPALIVALVASLAVMFLTLVLTNGIGAQTLAAALGVSVTLAFTCLLALFAVQFADLDGTTELEMLGVKAGSGMLLLKGVILAGMIVGALGVLADTAVTQASAVMALRRANPRYSARTLYREGFTIGRDHLSATIHTLVLAYAGAALPVLLVLQTSQVAAADAINGQSVAIPIVAAIVGCLGLMAAVPVTTALSAAILSRLPAHLVPEPHGHHH